MASRSGGCRARQAPTRAAGRSRPASRINRTLLWWSGVVLVDELLAEGGHQQAGPHGDRGLSSAVDVSFEATLGLATWHALSGPRRTARRPVPVLGAPGRRGRGRPLRRMCPPHCERRLTDAASPVPHSGVSVHIAVTNRQDGGAGARQDPAVRLSRR